MQADVDDHPARPPQQVAELEQTARGVEEEALLVHQLLAVERPALGEHAAVGQQPQAGARMVRMRQLQMVPGVGLVQHRERQRRVIVGLELMRLVLAPPADVDRRHEEVPGLVHVQGRGGQVGGVRRRGPLEQRRLDDLERRVQQRRQMLLFGEPPRPLDLGDVGLAQP